MHFNFSKNTTFILPDSNIFRDSIISLFIKLAGIIFTFLLHIFIARFLGVHEFGTYVVAINFTNILLVFSLCGQNQVWLRFIPEFLNANNYSFIRILIRFSRRLVLLSSILISFIILLLYNLLPMLPFPMLISMLLSAFYLPFLSLLSLESTGLRAFNKVFAALFPYNIIRPIIAFSLLYVFIYVITLSPVSFIAMLSIVISSIICVIIYRYLSRSLYLNITDSSSPSCFPYRTWLFTGIHMIFISGFGLLLRHIDVIMIGFIRSPSDAGIYYASVRIADFIIFGLNSVNFIIAPLISKYYFSGKHTELQRIITYSSRIIFSLTLIAFLFVILLGGWGLGLFGSDFLTSYPSLAILSIGQLVNALSGSVGYICIMTGHESSSSLVLGLSVIMNIILNYSLIVPFGIIGAAIATALTTIIWNLILVIYVYKRIGFNSTIF